MDPYIKTMLELVKERHEKEFAWIRHAISTVSILLGLLISLSKDNDIYFKITITLFGLNVLFGLIFLYDEVLHPHRGIQNLSNDNSTYDTGNGSKVAVSTRPWFFSFAKTLFFWTLFLSIASLIVFAWNKN